MQLLTIVSLLFAAVAVLFALQNTAVVTVSFFAWEFQSSLAIVLLLAVVVGALLMGLLSTPATVKLQWAKKRESKRADKLEREVADLKVTVARLEAQVPQVISEAVPEKPYVGLRQLIGGKPSGSSENAGSTLPSNGAN